MGTVMEGGFVRLKPWKGLVVLAFVLVGIGWLLNTPEGLLGKADAVGYAVCHRIDVRSFFFGERQLPLCARCTGMYLGAMLGLGFQALTGIKRSGSPPWPLIVVLGLLALAFAVDGLNSFASLLPWPLVLYEPNNTLRLFTGTGMGLVMAAAIFPAFNQTIWRAWDNRPALSSLPKLGLLLALAVGLDFIVLSENPFALYPLALVSAAGVLVLLTMVYAILWLTAFRFENRYDRFRQLGLPLVAGFGSGLAQIGLLDLGRYLLTGTWEGFHIG